MRSESRGNHALRVCMQALVLLNLVFVHLTGVAEPRWLLPLFALTLAAPLLERLREKLAYRILWNGGILCVFLILLRDALQGDLAFVLQDGLILTVLCQVHLLNNLRSSQRPDLLFFNAFLIAIVTGYISRGLGFPLAFVAFAPTFVIGLQLLNATRDGRVLSPAVTRSLVADGSRRAALLLCFSLLAFVFWPRDFERKAFFRGTFELGGDGPQDIEIGFSEELELGRSGDVEISEREALRVTLLEGKTTDVPALWRGATLSFTSDGAWHAKGPGLRRTSPSDESWQSQYGMLTRSLPEDPEACPLAEVVRFEQGTERVFAPLGAIALRLTAEHRQRFLRPRSDGTIDVEEVDEVRYQLSLAAEAGPEPGGRRLETLPAQLRPFIQLPDTRHVAGARDLATRLAARLPLEAEQHELVDLFRDHLSRTYVYLPPGADGAAGSLDEFLRGDTGGHCEFFASALATMLRSVEVPCRVVTGFRSNAWDATGRVLTFGMKDAHAWVEVHDPEAGWYAADPSPLLVDELVGTSFLARLQSAASSAWETVTSFDSERRTALFAWARALPGRTLAAARERPLDAALGLLLLLLPAALIRHRRRRRTRPEVRAYHEAVRRTKLSLEAGETPRELLERARGLGLAPARVEALAAATRRHEEARYAA